MPLLEVDRLCVTFPAHGGELRAVDDVGFSRPPGEVPGIVGASGSGTSVTMLAITGRGGEPGIVRAGRLTFDGRDLPTTGGAAAARRPRHRPPLRGRPPGRGGRLSTAVASGGGAG